MKATASLSKRQEEILCFLGDFTAKNGYPPSVREIGDAIGLSSSSTVHSHLSTLEDKGYIRRDPSAARALTIIAPLGMGASSAEAVTDTRRMGASLSSTSRDTADAMLFSDAALSKQPALPRNVVSLPLVGRVAAGAPILADQNIEESLLLPTQIVGDSSSFLLTVKGESMIEAGIFDGDYVVVREQSTANNGEIVVALIDDEATVKTFYREANRIRLQPENSSMEPIYSQNVTVLGKVVALLRTL